jgi:hypothetical protein
MVSVDKGPLRKMPHVNPLEINLEGIQRVDDKSDWAHSADHYCYDLKVIQGGVALGVLVYKNAPFAVYRTELGRSHNGSPQFNCETWALTDRWDEHMLTLDAFNLPDPPPKPVTTMDEDVISAPPKRSSIPKDHIL